MKFHPYVPPDGHLNILFVVQQVKGWKLQGIVVGAIAGSVCELWLGTSFAEEYKKYLLNTGRQTKDVGVCIAPCSYALGSIVSEDIEKIFIYTYRGW